MYFSNIDNWHISSPFVPTILILIILTNFSSTPCILSLCQNQFFGVWTKNPNPKNTEPKKIGFWVFVLGRTQIFGVYQIFGSVFLVYINPKPHFFGVNVWSVRYMYELCKWNQIFALFQILHSKTKLERKKLEFLSELWDSYEKNSKIFPISA